MTISQKCQYALRAIYELARRSGTKPVSVATIAEVQAIPPRFLEVILGQLRKKGFVQSRRGVQGGYLLAMPADKLTVGDVIRFIDGPLGPVRCVADKKEPACPLDGECAFMNLWIRARDAVAAVYDQTTFQDLVDEQREAVEKNTPSYTI